jgi:hypothetical protein
MRPCLQQGATGLGAHARTLLPIFEAIELAHGQAPPEVAARLTVDPWTGQPIRRARVPR